MRRDVVTKPGLHVVSVLLLLMLLISAGEAEKAPRCGQRRASTVKNNTRFARALELLGNYPFCSAYLAADPSLDRTPEQQPWGRRPLNMQVLVPDMAMAPGPFSQSLVAPRLRCWWELCPL